MRKRVFIAHQIRGDVKANIESAKQWCRWAIFARDINPVAPYLTLMSILDEAVKDERETGLILAKEYISICDEFWVCGPYPLPSSHVWKEIRIAGDLKIKTVDYTGLILPEHFHSVKSTT